MGENKNVFFDMKAFASDVVDVMAARGLTLEQLHEEVGVPLSFPDGAFRTNQIVLDELATFAKWSGVDLNKYVRER